MRMITGATRLYAIVGDPIAQAKSPQIYNARLEAAGVDAALVPWRLSAEAFDIGMRGLICAGNLDGVVFTYPHKQAALAFADIVTQRARQVGACNAMRRRADGRWEADMFDGVGLVRALQDAGRPVAGETVWLVGAGGAGRAIAFALAEAGARRLHVTDIEIERSACIVEDVMAAHPQCEARASAPRLEEIGVLINATTVGLHGGDSLPIAPVAALPAGLAVVDITPREDTALLALARRSGCRTVAGAAMIAGQAQAVLDFFADAG